MINIVYVKKNIVLNFIINVFNDLILNKIKAYLYNKKKQKQLAKYKVFVRKDGKDSNLENKDSSPPPSTSATSDNNRPESKKLPFRAAASESKSGIDVLKKKFEEQKKQRQEVAAKQPVDLKKKFEEQKKQNQELIKNKPNIRQKESFKDIVNKSRSDLVYLVRGKDKGRPAWHYVLVDKEKLPAFMRATQGGSLDVADYGSILHSGWGVDPPEDIVQEVKEKFGV